MARRTRRHLTDEEKRSICPQTTAPGDSVVQVARRYTVYANLIFKRLRHSNRPASGAGSVQLIGQSSFSLPHHATMNNAIVLVTRFSESIFTRSSTP